VIGNYEQCSFNMAGSGTFFGGEGAQPVVGSAGKLEQVDELRLEMVCPARALPAAARAIAEVHPYEEPAWDVYPLAPKPALGFGMGRAVKLETSASGTYWNASQGAFVNGSTITPPPVSVRAALVPFGNPFTVICTLPVKATYRRSTESRPPLVRGTANGDSQFRCHLLGSWPDPVQDLAELSLPRTGARLRIPDARAHLLTAEDHLDGLAGIPWGVLGRETADLEMEVRTLRGSDIGDSAESLTGHDSVAPVYLDPCHMGVDRLESPWMTDVHLAGTAVHQVALVPPEDTLHLPGSRSEDPFPAVLSVVAIEVDRVVRMLGVGL
jgi:hypothetical protein